MGLVTNASDDLDWRPVADYLLVEIGYAVPEHKFSLLDRACRPLLAEIEGRTVADLLRRIRDDRSLQQRLVNAVTINESLFFRDGKLWNDLTERVWPMLVEEVSFKRRIDVLLCACAAGQELYTLAMLREEAAASLRGLPMAITAIDVDTDALARAKAGCYSAFELSRGLDEVRRRRWFTELPNGEFQADRRLLAEVQFRQANLTQALPFVSRYDLVLCRNVLIYFDPDGKRQVFDRLARICNSYGFLVLGGTETTWGVTDAWRQRRLGSTTFYQKVY